MNKVTTYREPMYLFKHKVELFLLHRHGTRQHGVLPRQPAVCVRIDGCANRWSETVYIKLA